MAPPGDAHSRLVFWLKIILPLGALAILSTMFLVARSVVNDPTIPFSGVDVNDLANDQRLTAPEYSTVTADGASLSVQAATARPQGPGTGASATGVLATYSRDQRAVLTLTAPAATLDTAGRTLILTGGVRVRTTDGYDLDAGVIEARLDATAFLAEGPVTAIAPMGRIDAGRARFSSAVTAGGADVLVFNAGVRLVYQPKP